jgi:hypothetical protein
MNKGSLTALALGLSLFGCQTSYKFEEERGLSRPYQKEVNEWTGWEKVGIYLKDRALDAADILTFDVSVGDGFLATAHATKWLEVGAGYFDGLRYGLLRRSFGTWYDDRTEGGLAIGFNLYWVDVKRTPMWAPARCSIRGVSPYEGPDLSRQPRSSLERHRRYVPPRVPRHHGQLLAFPGSGLRGRYLRAADDLSDGLRTRDGSGR